MRKGENLVRLTSFKDSMIIKRSLLLHPPSLIFFFLLFEDTIDAVYFTLALCSTTESNSCWECTKKETHSTWQTRIYDQYIRGEDTFEPLPISDYQHWSNYYSLNTIDPQPLPSSIQKIRIGNLLQVQI